MSDKFNPESAECEMCEGAEMCKILSEDREITKRSAQLRAKAFELVVKTTEENPIKGVAMGLGLKRYLSNTDELGADIFKKSTEDALKLDDPGSVLPH